MRYLITIFLLFTAVLANPIDDRIKQIGAELRCPVCRGLPITESPSELAKAMLTELKNKLNQGLSDDEIRNFFVQKYGQSVLLSPPKSGINLIIWLGPTVILVLGSIFLWRYLKNSSKTQDEIDPEKIKEIEEMLKNSK